MTDAPDKPPTTAEVQVIAPAHLPSEDSAPFFTVKYMANFSGDLYRLARHLAVGSIEGPPYAAPMGAVVLSATAIEAFIGEQIEAFATMGTTQAEAAAKIHELNVRKRWVGLLKARSSHVVDPSGEPFAAFTLLVDLRNVLVHEASRFRVAGELPRERLAALASRYAFGPTDPGISWEQFVLNAACARWACNTSAAMVLEYWRVRRESPPSPNRWEPVP